MSDAVTGALAHQQPKRRLQPPTNVRNFNGTNVPIKLCKTCTDTRGISELQH